MAALSPVSSAISSALNSASANTSITVSVIDSAQTAEKQQIATLLNSLGSNVNTLA